MTEPTARVAVRRAGDPVPDLTDYRVVHRAMTTDLRRLAAAAADLVRRPDERRMRALRWYLRGLAHEIESHHHVEDADVWPLLARVATAAGERAALPELTEEHGRLDPLLHRAGHLAAARRAVPELAAVLTELDELLAEHVRHEEREIFPLIERHVTVADYRALQERFRGNVRPGLLPFLVPWALRHATPAERAVMLGEAPRVFALLLRATQGRFRAREALLFG